MSTIAKAPPSAKMPPMQKSATAPKQKATTTVLAKRPPSAAAETEVSEPVQKFFIEPTERTFIVKFNTQQFGVVKHEMLNRFENIQRGCESKDNKHIADILTVMKTYLRAGMSFAQLKERMSKNEALFAPTIKVFLNRINKE